MYINKKIPITKLLLVIGQCTIYKLQIYMHWCQRRRYLQLVSSLDERLNSHSSYKYITKLFYKNQVNF